MADFLNRKAPLALWCPHTQVQKQSAKRLLSGIVSIAAPSDALSPPTWESNRKNVILSLFVL